MYLGDKIQIETVEDLNMLIENSVAESKYIEYKRDLPGDSYEDHKEFLADVTAFANAEGGTIIYGIDAGDGVPREIKGYVATILDEEILRIENMLRSSVTPRIPGLKIKIIETDAGANVVVLSIPKSWQAPHLVKYRRHTRFYLRNSAGKAPMDYLEIKNAFEANLQTAERLTAVRDGRLALISDQRLPVILSAEPHLALHLIPSVTLTAAAPVNLSAIPALARKKVIKPVEVRDKYTGRFNLDGYVSYSRKAQSRLSHSYIQIFRNGMIEILDCGSYINLEEKIFYAHQFEALFISAVERSAEILANLEVPPPVYVLLTLLNMKSYELRNDPEYRMNIPYLAPGAVPVFDRETISIPGFIITEYSQKTDTMVREIINIVWNAAGFEKSPNFNENGRWIPDANQVS